MDFVSIASIASSFLATFGGIVVSGKLTSYRIEQLEKKVEKAIRNCDSQISLPKSAYIDAVGTFHSSATGG